MMIIVITIIYSLWSLEIVLVDTLSWFFLVIKNKHNHVGIYADVPASKKLIDVLRDRHRKILNIVDIIENPDVKIKPYK